MFININKIHEIQSSWYNWRQNANTITMTLMAFIFACFTGLMAQVSIAVPWSPVLITFQTFAVLMAGTLLGEKHGGLSMILYLIIGVAGVPWFSDANSGISAVLSASGGYLFGFIIAATFTGYVFDNYNNARKPLATMALMLFANWVLIYIPGLVGLYFYMTSTGATVTLLSLIMAGVVPFLFGDTLKVLLATGISTSILPKED